MQTGPELNQTSEARWQVRIGIHAGGAVAGVIGSHKFVYDVWGDAVNLASRLETSSLAGRIHVSERVAKELGDRFDLEARGEVDLKGKGTMQTYFLLPRRD